MGSEMCIRDSAWIYFISFVLVTAFVVLNLFIGIIVSTMQERHFEDESQRQAEQDERAHVEREEMLRLIRELNEKMDRLQR